MRLRSIPGSSFGHAPGHLPAASPPLDDPELISALLAGDPRAGPLLYERLVRVVEWTILRVIGKRSNEPADLVQSAFEQIVITLYRQRFARACSLTSWAASISCNVALNALRSQRTSRRWFGAAGTRPELGELRADTNDVESQVGARRELERVRRELANMKPERAKAVILHDVSGLELTEIARVM